MSGRVYDALELKDMIRKLKAKKQELNAESNALSEQIAKVATAHESAKKELISLGVDDELRQMDGDDGSALMNDKRFVEDNKKLELQLLNQDIKAVLPKLEAEAVEWEQKMHSVEKQASRAQADMALLPPNLTKSTAQLEEEYSELLERKAKLAASVRLENESKAHQLKRLKVDISKLRGQITTIVEQHSLVQQSINRLHTATLAEDTRREVLLKEYRGLKRAYDQLLRNCIAEESKQ